MINRMTFRFQILIAISLIDGGTNADFRFTSPLIGIQGLDYLKEWGVLYMGIGVKS